MTQQNIQTASTLVSDLASRHQEPDWLIRFREEAWQKFQAMPSPKLEKTDLTKRAWEVGPFPNMVSVQNAGDAEAVLNAEGVASVYVQDGVVIRVSAPESLKDQNIIFTDLQTAVKEHGELVQKYLGTVVPVEEGKWTALNAALWHGGAFVYVPRNTRAEIPFVFVYSESNEGAGALPRCLVIAEEGSELQYTEVFVSHGNVDSTRVHSSVTELAVKANAKVHATVVTQFEKGPTNFMVKRAHLGNDANVDWVYGDTGSGFTVATVESLCEGPASNSTMKAIGIGTGRQHMELTAGMVHKGHHSTSDIVMHGVLRGRANSIYRSRTHIVKGAASASSEQSDRMIVLDSTSRADAIPMLLIDEHDVSRCGHAASVGKIDPNMIYYMMSRGIPEQVATQMVIWGYLQPTVDDIPVEAVRTLFTQRIERELSK